MQHIEFIVSSCLRNSNAELNYYIMLNYSYLGHQCLVTSGSLSGHFRFRRSYTIPAEGTVKKSIADEYIYISITADNLRQLTLRCHNFIYKYLTFVTDISIKEQIMFYFG